MKHQLDDEKLLEQQSRGLLRRGLKVEVQAPPFMAQRILTRLETQSEKQKQVTWWRWAAVLSPVFSVILVVGLLQLNPRFHPPLEGVSFTAEVDKAYAVRVELAELDTSKARSAQILLPEGVAFFSRDYPELAEKNSLELNIDSEFNLEALPFIISSSSEGLKRILVRFFDQDNNVVDEKSVSIHFKPAVAQENKG